MSSEEQGLLHDICANPIDIAPRLVYADWLDERRGKGDCERAELIRLQCRLTGPEKIDTRERKRLLEREKALLETWGKVWMKPLRGCFARYEYRRGFVERVTVQTKVFVARSEEILAQTPLRFVKLRDPKAHVAPLAQAKALARLEGLSLNYGNLGQARVKTFLASPHLGNLRWLDLGNNNIARTGLITVCEALERLGGLRLLALDDNNIQDLGVDLLALSPLLGQLEGLNLDANELTDSSLRSLASSPHCSRLRQLHIGRNLQLTTEGVRQLLSSPHLANLRALSQDARGLANREQLQREFGRRVNLNPNADMVQLEAELAGKP